MDKGAANLKRSRTTGPEEDGRFRSRSRKATIIIVSAIVSVVSLVKRACYRRQCRAAGKQPRRPVTQQNN